MNRVKLPIMVSIMAFISSDVKRETDVYGTEPNENGVKYLYFALSDSPGQS
jgi:hypothetical protein